ncbi:MAG: aspartyl/glutamyl-tRNA amidotransferase subunit C [Planctomycetota bacterium]|jgi:aspartyl-tRNA(Asn)/glutamyl-tRNA(Gln) amidotransferase subunit C|nr:aspartyl/glutamyl-tRNA amidotransferase subunit C [Planctomycetota bacterium]
MERSAMIIDAQEVLRLSEMLRMALTQAEAERMAGDMSSVIDYVGLLNELDVSGVDAMGRAILDQAPLRDDVPGPSLGYPDLEALGGGAFDPATAAFLVQGVFAD